MGFSLATFEYTADPAKLAARLFYDFINVRAGAYGTAEQPGAINHYDARPDQWDIQEGTKFIVVIDDDTGKVVGGRRAVIHKPGKDTKLKLQSEFSPFSGEGDHVGLEQILTHMSKEQIKGLCYAELGSFCLDPQYRYKALQDRQPGAPDLAEMLYDETFKLLKTEGVDIILSNLLPANAKRFAHAVMQSEYKEQFFILRPEDRELTFDDPGKDPNMLFVGTCRHEDDLLLVSKAMREKGVVVPPSDVNIERVISSSAEVTKARSGAAARATS